MQSSFSVPCLTSKSVPFKPYCTAALGNVPDIHLENYAEKVLSVQTVRTSISVLYGLCTASRFVQCTDCNKSSPLLVFCALLDLDFCALQTLLYGCLENRALLPFFSLGSLSFS